MKSHKRTSLNASFDSVRFRNRKSGIVEARCTRGTHEDRIVRFIWGIKLFAEKVIWYSAKISRFVDSGVFGGEMGEERR